MDERAADTIMGEIRPSRGRPVGLALVGAAASANPQVGGGGGETVGPGSSC